MTHPRREQGTRDEAPPNFNHQRRPDAGQENVMPQNNTAPTNGASSSASPAGTGPNMVDISNLATNAMLLVKQLLTTIAEKSSTEGKPTEEVEMKPKENNKTETHDVPESSAPGEARGTLGINKVPYCHRCLDRGHAKEECDV
jgi:hypothetical protein